MATENEKKFLTLVHLYDTNNPAFYTYIESLTSQNRPNYNKFKSDVGQYVINAIEGYKSYNEFMDVIQYFPDPRPFIKGGKHKTNRRKNLRNKKTKRHRN